MVDPDELADFTPGGAVVRGHHLLAIDLTCIIEFQENNLGLDYTTLDDCSSYRKLISNHGFIEVRLKLTWSILL